MIQHCKNFDVFANDPKSEVIEIYPNVIGDDRGSFAEILKENVSDHSSWLSDLSWIKQVNRSKSKSGVIRGCHAQKAPFCQGKLVQAVTGTVYDIITDARPDSESFGTTSVFKLDSKAQNLLWVPRGFLHAFVVPKSDVETVFEYFCDNVYDKASETSIAPLSLLPKCVEELAKVKDFESEFKLLIDMFSNDLAVTFALSEKDAKAPDYAEWMKEAKQQYDTERKVWYR